MKKVITLGLSLFLLNSLFAQKLDYDTDSKWYFGFNVGGTWNTTDVKNKTHLGWGLMLGRQFNYNYGKALSYDIRLRYLGGNWYGQDYDTTNVSGNSLYDPAGEVAQHYDSLGYTINNFNTEAHELGLELAIHLNGLRERTGWDPYIFGGAGIVWSQTHGDLLMNDSLGTQTYDYQPGGMSKSEWNQMTDNIYDTPLEGSADAYSVSFVPNLGVGLAYQVGPKFSIGLEHRTMFYMKNTFDGFNGASTKWGLENDLYHYTSLLMRFNIGKGRTDTDVNTNTNTGTNGIVGGGGCETPNVTIRRPGQSTITVTDSEYRIESIVKNVASRDNIQFSVNGSASTNFVYNTTSAALEATILLNPGTNTIVVKGSNACGSTEDRVTIIYQDCVEPKVRFTKPSGSGTSVDQPLFVVNASIQNATTVTYEVNGLSTSNFMLSGSNFSSNVALREGVNSIRIIASNDCGTEEQTVNINYAPCIEPTLSFIQPAGSSLTVNAERQLVIAMVDNVTSVSQITLKVNGTVKPGGKYNSATKRFEQTVDLREGANTIEIDVNGACGSIGKATTITRRPCVGPQISMVQPVTSNFNSPTNSLPFKASVAGVTTAGQIKLFLNGLPITGFSYSPSSGLVQKTLSLKNGTNTIKMVATNDCSSQEVNFTVNFTPCIAPTVTLTSPASAMVTESGVLQVSAKVTNISSTNEIQFTVNGAVFIGGSYNNATNVFTRSVNLVEGVNNIVIKATTSCGSAQDAVAVTLTHCDEPSVQIISPIGRTNNSEVNTAVIKAKVENIDSPSQIKVMSGGSVVPGGVYNNSTKLFQITVNLSAGLNSFDVIATTDCGSSTGTVNINYDPCQMPTVQITAPTVSETTAQQVTMKATVLNVSSAANIVLKVNGVIVTGGTYNAVSGLFQKTIDLNVGSNRVELKATNDCGTADGALRIKRNEEGRITICHHPPGNPENTQELSIPLSAWAAHQAHGDVLGPCPEETITICHHPPGNPTNTQQITIPISAWPAHQAHGDTQGTCPPAGNGGGSGEPSGTGIGIGGSGGSGGETGGTSGTPTGTGIGIGGSGGSGEGTSGGSEGGGEGSQEGEGRGKEDDKKDTEKPAEPKETTKPKEETKPKEGTKEEPESSKKKDGK